MNMKHLRLGIEATAMTLAMMLLIGCVGPAVTAPPTATPLPQPATATATLTPPTATFTPVPPTATATSFPPTVTPAPEQPAASPTEAFTPVTSAEQIVGVWRSGGYYLRFDGDGTFRQARGLERLDGAPYAICSYRFDGASMVIKQVKVAGVPSCREKVGTYELRLLDDGSLRIVAIADECAPRAGDVGGVWWAEPTTPAPAPTLGP
jgi:hypothetical protein